MSFNVVYSGKIKLFLHFYLFHEKEKLEIYIISSGIKKKNFVQRRKGKKIRCLNLRLMFIKVKRMPGKSLFFIFKKSFSLFVHLLINGKFSFETNFWA